MFRIITKPKPEQERLLIESRLEDAGACVGLPASLPDRKMHQRAPEARQGCTGELTYGCERLRASRGAEAVHRDGKMIRCTLRRQRRGCSGRGAMVARSVGAG
jgi:hypothetical protein